MTKREQPLTRFEGSRSIGWLHCTQNEGSAVVLDDFFHQNSGFQLALLVFFWTQSGAAPRLFILGLFFC